jgi:eukaryotic-like serine/threonine-protein kinase
MVLLPGGRVPVANSRDQGQVAALTRVELDPFFVSKYELTAAQWERIDGWQRSRDEGDALMPASDLSWDDCQIALGRNVGWLRLPTDAQWEYACRARTATKWWTGDDVDELKAAADLRFGNESQRVQAIGLLKANDFGLHDVHGNVWEWCQDADGGGSATLRAGGGLYEEPSAANRVIRGGVGWPEPEIGRSSDRYVYAPEIRYGTFGLRPSQGIAP